MLYKKILYLVKKRFLELIFSLFLLSSSALFFNSCYAIDPPKFLDKNEEILIKKAYSELINGKYDQSRKTIAKISDPTAMAFIKMMIRIKAPDSNKYKIDVSLLENEMMQNSGLTTHTQLPKISYTSMAQSSVMKKTDIENIVNDFKKAKQSAKEEKILNATKQIQSAWRIARMTTSEENDFLKNYGNLLTQEDKKIRLENYIYCNNAKRAKNLLKTLKGKNHRVIKAALEIQSAKNKKEIQQIRKTIDTNKEESIVQFATIKWLKNNSKNSEAISELVKTNIGYAEKNEAWWFLARYYIRDLLMKNSTRTMNKWAYILATKYCPQHSSDAQYIDAEWTAGWIALRFLKVPHVAYSHFAKIYSSGKATTIYSLSRASYWAARASEDMGNYKNAEQWFNISSSFSTTFYGQIATCKLDKLCEISLPMNIIRHEDKQKILSDQNVKYIYYASVIGNELLAEKILNYVISSNKSNGELELIAAIPAKFGLANVSVAAAKLIAYNKRLLLINSLYPIIKDKNASALEHSIIRQESLFRKNSVSSAGAIGMMQLMPTTAREVAKKLSIKYSDSMLYNVEYNIKLGKHHFYKELKDLDSSLILTIAAYNAGRHRANKWIKCYGDPRTMNDYKNVIDWIELIPFGETRDYVQRVMEGLQVYKKIMNSNEAKTNILYDITSKYKHEYDSLLNNAKPKEQINKKQ